MTAETLSGHRPPNSRLYKQAPCYNPSRLGLACKDAGDLYETTVYQEAYQRWPYQARRNTKRPPLQLSENKEAMDMNSVYRMEYRAHKAPERFEKKRPLCVPPKVKMEATTTYVEDFATKDLSATNSFKPTHMYTKPVVPFNGSTVYTSKFMTYSPTQCKESRPRPVRLHDCIDRGDPNEKFQHTSTVKEDYQKHENVARPKPIIPEENTKLSGEPMDGTTTYKQYYTSKEISSVQPVGPKCSMMFSGPFDGVTTFAADYKPHHGFSRQPAFLPPSATAHLQATEYKPDNLSTQNVDFKSWSIHPRETPRWAKKVQYQRPVGTFMTSSTYKSDFGDINTVPPASPNRPKQRTEFMLRHRDTESTFDDTTTYHLEFKNWEKARPANSFKVNRTYLPPNESMLCESTKMAHYKGEISRRPDNCRHPSEHRDLNTDKRMYFDTTYDNTYQGSKETQEDKNVDPRSKTAPCATQNREE